MLYSMYERFPGEHGWKRASDYAYPIQLARTLFMPRLIERALVGREVSLRPAEIVPRRAQGRVKFSRDYRE